MLIKITDRRPPTTQVKIVKNSLHSAPLLNGVDTSVTCSISQTSSTSPNHFPWMKITTAMLASKMTRQTSRNACTRKPSYRTNVFCGKISNGDIVRSTKEVIAATIDQPSRMAADRRNAQLIAMMKNHVWSLKQQKLVISSSFFTSFSNSISFLVLIFRILVVVCLIKIRF